MRILYTLPIALLLPALAWGQVPAPVVVNPSFEQGVKGWNMPHNATVVADQAFAGQHSARLVVHNLKTDAVYITQQVPIVGGSKYTASCRVKTTGVVAGGGGRENVGAGLIVEWADKQGKWYAAGAYATGLYGDHDWTLREAKNLRAPEQAGFAIIFLTLRAAGTAWFDDVQLVPVADTLKLQSPAAGQTLHDNTPTLSWQDDPQAASYTVELSRNQAFPPDATQELHTDQASVTIPKPIAPGVWYWRVTAPGYDLGETRSFTQTAAVTEDTNAPQVTAEPTRVIQANEPAHFRVQWQGTSDPKPLMTVTLAGKSLPVTFQPAGQGELEAAVIAPWQPGLNRLTITTRDPAGNTASQPFIVLYRPVPASPVVISGDGAYVVGGKRAFPRGIYQVLPQFMAKVKAAGFQVVHYYFFESSQDDKAAKAYVDAAAAAGLRVFIGFDRGTHSGHGLIQGNREEVISRVATLCDNPGLFCWYLYDEPESEHQYVSSRGLIAYANLIRHLDPYHAVVVTTWGPRMAQYRPSFDTHWTQAYTTPAGVVKQIQEHRKQLGQHFPITLIAHCFDRQLGKDLVAGKPVDLSKFQPDGAWMRASAFAGITQRINGLWWWWYAGGVKTGPCAITVAKAPAAWQALAEVQSQLKALEPVLVDPTQPQTGEVKIANGKLYWWRKTVGQETTVIAVNTTEQTAKIAVPAPGDGPAQVLFENRQVQRQGGRIIDSFKRYGVHVYRFTQG